MWLIAICAPGHALTRTTTVMYIITNAPCMGWKSLLVYGIYAIG